MRAYPAFRSRARGLLTGPGRLRPAWEVGSVLLEVDLPDEWPPGLGLAVAAMIRRSLRDGFPVVIPIRRDATPEELEAAVGCGTVSAASLSPRVSIALVTLQYSQEQGCSLARMRWAAAAAHAEAPPEA